MPICRQAVRAVYVTAAKLMIIECPVRGKCPAFGFNFTNYGGTEQ